MPNIKSPLACWELMGHKSNSNFIFQIFQQNRSVHTTKSNTTICCLIFLFHIKESKAEHRHKIRTLRLVSSPTFLRYQTEATSSNINFCYPLHWPNQCHYSMECPKGTLLQNKSRKMETKDRKKHQIWPWRNRNPHRTRPSTYESTAVIGRV